MRIAHVIITYTSPLLTERMIRHMMHADFDFYIHVDSKKDFSAYAFLEKLPNVYFITKRIDVRWAGFSTVEAVLNSIRQILATGKEYGYINLLSGQGYPIKTAEEILGFYKANAGKLFMKYDSFDEWTEAQARITQYHLVDYRFPGKYWIEKLINFLFPERKPPIPLKFYGRSMFWSLTPESLRYVLKIHDQNPSLHRFFKFTWGSDEFFFQTILLNSSFASQVENMNCTYYDHKPHVPSPRVLVKEDFPAIEGSDKLFARKFDMGVDSEVLDMIDAMLDKKKALSGR